jgi:hypothetical protein
MTVLTTFALIAVALFVWACLFKIIPNCLLSLFRYKLWRQRDELALEIRRDEYEHRESAEMVLEEIECFIEGAPQLSPLNIALLYFCARGVVVVPEDRLILRKLPTDERARLESTLDNFHRAVAKHVLFGTPSGWLTVFLAVPMIPVVLFFRALADEGKQLPQLPRLKADTRERVSQGSLALMSTGHAHHHPQPLSQYV